MLYREHRADGDVFVCETSSSSLRAIPAWMFEPACGVSLTAGQAAVSLGALGQLRWLLLAVRSSVVASLTPKEAACAKLESTPSVPEADIVPSSTSRPDGAEPADARRAGPSGGRADPRRRARGPGAKR